MEVHTCGCVLSFACSNGLQKGTRANFQHNNSNQPYFSC